MSLKSNLKIMLFENFSRSKSDPDMIGQNQMSARVFRN